MVQVSRARVKVPEPLGRVFVLLGLSEQRQADLVELCEPARTKSKGTHVTALGVASQERTTRICLLQRKVMQKAIFHF